MTIKFTVLLGHSIVMYRGNIRIRWFIYLCFALEQYICSVSNCFIYFCLLSPDDLIELMHPRYCQDEVFGSLPVMVNMVPALSLINI